MPFSPPRVPVGWTCHWFGAGWPASGTSDSLPHHVFRVGAVRKVIATRTTLIGLCRWALPPPAVTYSNHIRFQCFFVSFAVSLFATSAAYSYYNSYKVFFGALVVSLCTTCAVECVCGLSLSALRVCLRSASIVATARRRKSAVQESGPTRSADKHAALVEGIRLCCVVRSS